MKKILSLSTALILAISCATVSNAPRVVETSFLDYRPYSEKGFFISPNSYQGECVTLGELNIFVKPSSTEMTVSGDELIQIAVDKAKEVNADAIVNFAINTLRTTKISKYGSNTSLDGYEIEGLLIMRGEGNEISKTQIGGKEYFEGNTKIEPNAAKVVELVFADGSTISLTSKPTSQEMDDALKVITDKIMQDVANGNKSLARENYEKLNKWSRSVSSLSVYAERVLNRLDEITF